MTLREKLIVLRDKAGISQMSLAHQADVPATFVRFQLYLTNVAGTSA